MACKDPFRNSLEEYKRSACLRIVRGASALASFDLMFRYGCIEQALAGSFLPVTASPLTTHTYLTLFHAHHLTFLCETSCLLGPANSSDLASHSCSYFPGLVSSVSLLSSCFASNKTLLSNSNLPRSLSTLTDRLATFDNFHLRDIFCSFGLFERPIL